MTGAEDFVVFCMGGFIFLPLFIEMAISLVRMKENENIRIIILIFSLALQIILFHVWLDAGSIFLNLLFGDIRLKIWLSSFFIIIAYLVYKVIKRFLGNAGVTGSAGVVAAKRETRGKHR
jgi:hypothetical protein